MAALGLPPAPSVRHEYSSMDVTLELVGGLDEAIDHIHAHGSGHTECILTGGAGRMGLESWGLWQAAVTAAALLTSEQAPGAL